VIESNATGYGRPPESPHPNGLPVAFFAWDFAKWEGDIMATDFSGDFNRLADRFASITADNADDGERYLRNTSAAAFTTLDQAVKAGVLTGLDIPAPTADKSDIERQEHQAALAWYGFCVNFGRKQGIRNPSLFRKSGDGHIARAKDWQQRGHNYATICRLLGEMCGVAAERTTSLTTPSNGGRPKRRRRKPGDLNGAMLDTLQNNRDSRGWSCGKWAKTLKCHTPQIVVLAAWKALEDFRRIQKIQRQKDRHGKGCNEVNVQ